MLKKVNEGGVMSDEGFSLQIIHPEYLEYKDGQNCIEISIGFESTSQKIYIHVSDVKELSEAKREEIANNIRKAVTLLKGDFEVI